jgi:hypothetical protein
MAVVNATLCLPFQPAQEVIESWEQSVREACKRTSFPHEEEVADVLSQIKDFLPPLLYARLIESISVDFGHAEVQYALRYDAAPSDVDELALDILDLVLDPPGACCITLTLGDLEKAMFLNCLVLESYATEHVSVVIGLSA